MNTEITDNNNNNGIVLYDADCAACRSLAHHFHPWLSRHGFELLPLQTPEIQERLRLNGGDPLAEIRLLRPDGTVFGGVDALLEISRQYWWALPIRQAARIPAIARILRWSYRWIARHRYCLNGACEIKRPPANRFGQAIDFLPLLIFPMVAMFLRPHVANWIFMWAMAFGLYAGCKWQTYQAASRSVAKPGWGRAVGYLLAYPGMNAGEFLEVKNIPLPPRPMDWVSGAIKIFTGVILLYGVAPHLFPMNPLLAGWAGMIGLILILHFGLFHWLALAWQCVGVKATPLMLSPLRATSLAEFWGRRWNTGFKELSWQWLFRPLQHRTGAITATLLVFGASGLVHELVISLPARGGYGLPTFYFLLQGVGLIAERTPFARHLGLGRGWRGWLFTILVTAAPVFWLFHPPFIQHVILPMLHVIGATGKTT